MPHYIVKKYDKYDHDDRQQRDLTYTKRSKPRIPLRNILEHGSTTCQAVNHTRKHRAHPERRNEGENPEPCHDPAVDPADDKADQDRADKTQGQRHAGDSHQCADHPTKAGHAADGKIEFIDTHYQRGADGNYDHERDLSADIDKIAQRKKGFRTQNAEHNNDHYQRQDRTVGLQHFLQLIHVFFPFSHCITAGKHLPGCYAVVFQQIPCSAG